MRRPQRSQHKRYYQLSTSSSVVRIVCIHHAQNGSVKDTLTRRTRMKYVAQLRDSGPGTGLEISCPSSRSLNFGKTPWRMLVFLHIGHIGHTGQELAKQTNSAASSSKVWPYVSSMPARLEDRLMNSWSDVDLVKLTGPAEGQQALEKHKVNRTHLLSTVLSPDTPQTNMCTPAGPPHRLTVK